MSAGEPMAMLPPFGNIAPWSPEDTPVPRDGAWSLPKYLQALQRSDFRRCATTQLRSTAFILDRYPGPCALKNSRTSESTRNEIGVFRSGAIHSAAAITSSVNSGATSGSAAIWRRMSASSVRIKKCRRSNGSWGMPWKGRLRQLIHLASV